MPIGAEVTGPYINANDVLLFNISHPDGANLYPYNRSLIGVMTVTRRAPPLRRSRFPGDAQHG
ncbi:MAG: hypothetical protein R2867_31990 [Caldilineaceae bacterium]